MTLDPYLQRMPKLTGIVTQALASGPPPLAQKSVLLVHHLSAEILGTIAALRELGCRDIVTVFVGYNVDLEGAYRPALDDVPDQELRCYILGTKSKGGGSSDQIYFIPRTFLKQPKGEDTAVLDALDATMRAKGLDFLAAMRALIVQVGLAQIARSLSAGHPLLIIEDGGYTAPILNDAALSGITVAQMRARYYTPIDTATDAHLPAAMKEVVTGTILGSVEHTRNGYDANMRVYLAYGRLAVPAFSIAVSYLKTQVESETVAATILNAIESVLYSNGADLRPRNVFLVGSRGNVGRRLMAQLRAVLDTPDRTLIGCDLKVSRPDITTQLPPWQLRPTQSSACGASEVTTYGEVDSGRARTFDLILGVTGGPTPGHPVLQVNDVVTWLLNGEALELYIASGSTKTDEFPEVLAWMNSLLAASGEIGGMVNVDVGGNPARLHKEDLIDVLSHRRFGSRYVFNIKPKDGATRDRSLVFMQDLMPVNFLFYGCPTEIIDVVLAQLISASLALLCQASSLPFGAHEKLPTAAHQN